MPPSLKRRPSSFVGPRLSPRPPPTHAQQSIPTAAPLHAPCNTLSGCVRSWWPHSAWFALGHQQKRSCRMHRPRRSKCHMHRASADSGELQSSRYYSLPPASVGVQQIHLMQQTPICASSTGMQQQITNTTIQAQNLFAQPGDRSINWRWTSSITPARQGPHRTKS